MSARRFAADGVLVCLAATCLFFAGCPQTQSPDPELPEALPFEGVRLQFVIPRSLQLSQRWAAAINDWADENAANVEVLEADFAEPSSTWLDGLTAAPTSLVLLPTPQLGELVGADLAAPGPRLADGTTPEWHQVPPSLRTAVAVVGRTETFAAASSPTPMLVIRSDLLESAGRTVPRTWAEYDLLVRERESWAPELAAVEPRDAASLASLFLARALSAAKHPAQLSVELDVSDAQPLIASEPFVRALEEMQALTPHLSDEVREMSPTDCAHALADGSAAIAVVWAADGEVPPPAKTDTNGDPVLTCHPLPGREEIFDREEGEWIAANDGGINRPALCGIGGYSAAVTNVGTRTEQAAAWDLWGLLVRYQTDQTIPPLPGLVTSGSETALGELLEGLSPAESQSCAQAQAANLHNSLLVCEIPMFGRSRLRTALTAAIQKALDDDVDPAAALEQAREEWTQIISEIGRTRVLNSYRVRLGLIPMPE